MHFKPVLYLVLAFCAFSCVENTPGQEEPEEPEVPVDDPVLAVSHPGAYGVSGGNEVLEEGGQTSFLQYSGGASWRLIHPSSGKVVSLSGLPEKFRRGARVGFLYRVIDRGIVRESQPFSGVEVLQVTDTLVWLKKDEHTYFVLQP